jgi:hypothetical protein
VSSPGTLLEVCTKVILDAMVLAYLYGRLVVEIWKCSKDIAQPAHRARRVSDYFHVNTLFQPSCSLIAGISMWDCEPNTTRPDGLTRDLAISIALKASFGPSEAANHARCSPIIDRERLKRCRILRSPRTTRKLSVSKDETVEL